MKHEFFFAIINIGVVLGQFLECSKQEDCVASDAVCVDYLCQCPIDKVYSMDGSQCLDLMFAYDSPCAEDNQCAWLLGNNECANGKCRCSAGWVYNMGKCIQRAAPKEQCQANGQCYNGYDPLAMVCKNDVCECNDGYYLRGDNDCRPISAKDEYCSLNSDCQFNNGVCQNSFCKDNLRLYNTTLVIPKDKRLESFNATKINIQCVSNSECEVVPNSVCNLHFKKCICKRGYRFISESGKCLEELGTVSNCVKDSDCYLKYTRCLDGKCYCRKTYFSIDGNAKCQKPMTHDNTFCNNNERCYVLGKEGICEDNKCKCSSPDPPNSDYVCEAIGCNTNNECGELANSICVNKVCQCPVNFHIDGDGTICLPDLGSKCSDSAPCIIQHAACQDNVCSCNNNFIQDDKACFRLAATINDTCEVQKQCTLIPNSECVASTCKCASGYVEIDRKCVWKTAFGDACRVTSQCRTFLGDKVVCRNGYCICPVDMVPTAKKDNCESLSNSLSFSYLMIILLLTFNLMSC